ncbi:MAG: UDP-N-acetylmuramoyl-tripeptide--D-alanyl-D-alanine ligase [Mariprofundaceae bacterium]
MSGMELARATGGVWHGEPPRRIDGVSTDSRHLRAGQAFVALRGPHFDGHRFAADIADRAAALIGDAKGLRGWEGLPAPKLEVADTLTALGDIARAWRDRLVHTRVVAISGSCGKTGLRSMLEHGLRRLGFHVAATRANLNNLIGVPLTLLDVPLDADIALIECGISERGEMARLAEIVVPDAVVLTALAEAHGEGLGDLTAIAREKSRLLAPLAARKGWAALGEGVARVMADAGIAVSGQVLSLDDMDLDWSLDGRICVLRQGGALARFPLPLPARHWAHNLALATLVIERLCADLDRPANLTTIGRAMADWTPPAGRLYPQRLASGALLLDDSYNANPASMQAALDTLRALDTSGRRIAVLGDMAELGETADAAHRALDVAGIDTLWLVGPHMARLAATRPDARCFPDAEAAIRALPDLRLGAGDAVLVKASRALQLDRVADALRAMAVEARDAV